jgi:hypothetical protein
MQEIYYHTCSMRLNCFCWNIFVRAYGRKYNTGKNSCEKIITTTLGGGNVDTGPGVTVLIVLLDPGARLCAPPERPAKELRRNCSDAMMGKKMQFFFLKLGCGSNGTYNFQFSLKTAITVNNIFYICSFFFLKLA